MAERSKGDDELEDGNAAESTGSRQRLDVDLGSLRLVHGAVLELEGLTNVAIRHAAQAERQADRAYKLQIDHSAALDRMSRSIADLKSDATALGKSIQSNADIVEGHFAGLAQHLRDANVAGVPELVAEVRALRKAVGRLPDDSKKGDEGEGLLGWMGTSRRRYAVITALAGVVGAGTGGAIVEIARRLLGGH